MKNLSQKLETISRFFEIGELKKYSRAGGFTNDNFFIQTDYGDYVIKILREQTAENVRTELPFTKILQENNFPGSFYLSNSTNEFVYSNGNTTAVAMVTEQGSAPSVTADITFSMGQIMARLHSIPSEHLTPRFTWFSPPFIPTGLNKIESIHGLEKVRKYQKAYEKIGNVKKFSTRKSIIHGDFTCEHLLFNGRSSVRVIDWETISIASGLIDLASAVINACFKNSVFNPDLFSSLIEGYQTVRALNHQEHLYFDRILRYVGLVRSIWLFLRYGLYSKDPKIIKLRNTYWEFDLENPIFSRLLAKYKLPVSVPPPSRQRELGPVNEAQIVTIQLLSALSGVLSKFSQRHNASLSTTLLTAFLALIHRYGESSDIIVGIQDSGPGDRMMESTIGAFQKMLPLRMDFYNKSSFLKILKYVQKMEKQTHPHQTISFEKFIEDFSPDLDFNRSSVVRATFQMETAAGLSTENAKDRMDPLELEQAIPSYDLSLLIKETPEVLSCVFTGRTHRFNQSAIERIATHYRTFIERVIAEPDQPLFKIPLLTEAEEQLLLHKWNDTDEDYPKESCIHHLFEEQAKLTPSAAAIISGNNMLTYGELYQTVKKVAAELIHHNVSEDIPVALLIERSANTVVAIFSVLAAGGFYVPLDCSWPSLRIRSILDDCRAPVLLTSTEMKDKVPEDYNWVVI